MAFKKKVFKIAFKKISIQNGVRKKVFIIMLLWNNYSFFLFIDISMPLHSYESPILGCSFNYVHYNEWFSNSYYMP